MNSDEGWPVGMFVWMKERDTGHRVQGKITYVYKTLMVVSVPRGDVVMGILRGHEGKTGNHDMELKSHVRVLKAIRDRVRKELPKE